MTSSQITIAAALITCSGIGGSILLSVLKERFPDFLHNARVQDYLLFISGIIYLLATLFTVISLIGGECYIFTSLILVFIGTSILVFPSIIILIFIAISQVVQIIAGKRIQTRIQR